MLLPSSHLSINPLKLIIFHLPWLEEINSTGFRLI